MINRRDLLRAIGAAALIAGFDPLRRRWIPSAEASSCPSFADLPPLDGAVVTDGASLAADSTDLGNIVRKRPCAVLHPGSAEDIAKMVGYCRAHGIKVAARGQAHTDFGQGLVACGLIVEMKWLDAIHSIDASGAEVDGGVQWRALIEAAYPQGLTPAAVTGYTRLSIGGTLSVGGSPLSNAKGALVDHAQSLEVVTGAGDLVTCSPATNADLFEAMLAGLGQCGIITKATVDLVPAKPKARLYVIPYQDNATFFQDFRTLVGRGEVDECYNLFAPPGTALGYQIMAAVFYDPSSPPDDRQILRGLSGTSAPPLDLDFLTYKFLVDTIYDLYEAALAFDRVVKPWFDVWLPDSTVEQYVGEVIPTLTPLDVGPTGFVVLFAQRRSQMTRRFLRLPAPDGSDWVYLFDVLTSSALPGPNPGFARRMLERNRTLFDEARAAGATRYPIGAIEFSRDDWIAQYGDSWSDFVALKQLYDPDDILAPGPGIF